MQEFLQQENGGLVWRGFQQPWRLATGHFDSGIWGQLVFIGPDASGSQKHMPETPENSW